MADPMRGSRLPQETCDGPQPVLGQAPRLIALAEMLLWAGRWLAVLTPVLLVGGMVAADIGATTVAIAFLAVALCRREFGWLREPWVIAALALCAAATIRGLFSLHPLTSSVQALVWVRFILFGAAVQSWMLPQAEWRRRLLHAIAAAVGLLAADALWQCATGADILGRPILGGRLTGPFRHPRLGITLAWIFLPAVLGLYGNGRRFAAGLLGAAALAAIVLSGDRMALLFALAALLLAVVLTRSLWRPAFVVIPVIVLLVGGIFLMRPGTYQRQVTSTATVISDIADSPYGIIWRRALQIAAAHPLLGVGTHNYRYACVAPDYGLLKAETKGGSMTSRCSTHPHNIYLEWLIGLGALGLTGFVIVIGLLAVPMARGLLTAGRDPLFVGFAVTALLRMWPVQPTTSFFIAWSAVPFWLVVGGAMSGVAGWRRRALDDSR